MQTDLQVCKYNNSEEIESIARVTKSQKAVWRSKGYMWVVGSGPEDTWKDRQWPGP